MKRLLMALAVGAAALNTGATPINHLGENNSSASQSLQSILNARLAGGSVNVNNNQVIDDAYWLAETYPAAYLVIEVAGYNLNNSFGIYKSNDPSKTVEVLKGEDSAPFGLISVAVPADWSSFGFYLKNTVNGNFTWYSDSTLNAGGHKDHMVAFRGRSGLTLNVGGARTFDANDYVLAWEDLNLGDWDYQDMVVLVQNVRPVPDGGFTLTLLGLGLLSFSAYGRRSRSGTIVP